MSNVIKVLRVTTELVVLAVMSLELREQLTKLKQQRNSRRATQPAGINPDTGGSNDA